MDKALQDMKRLFPNYEVKKDYVIFYRNNGMYTKYYTNEEAAKKESNNLGGQL